MSRPPLLLLLTLVLVTLAAWPGSPARANEVFGLSLEELLAPQALPETVGFRRDPALRVSEMIALQDRLNALRVESATRRAFRVELTDVERQRIDVDGSAERRYLVGVARAAGLDVALDTARVTSAAGNAVQVGPGAARGIGNRDLVWTSVFEAPGAAAMRLSLSGLDLPKGAELYVYNLAGQAFGPYVGRGPLGDGDLYTHTVFGDRLYLQLQITDGADATVRFRVEEVGVMGQRFLPARFGPALTTFDGLATEASNLCSYNADCIVNAACQSSNVVNGAKDAVATMLFRSGGSYYICTGGLIADTDNSTVVPYFLTANHCIGSGREASSLETFFDYQTTCANPNCTQPYNNNGDTVGATLLNASSSDDHSLLRLSSAPVTADGVATYLGWTSSAVANTNGTQLYRISHPSGAPQAYSEQRVDTTKGTCTQLPRGRFIYSTDTVGATEGGSSGSPVINGAGQIVGQLYGACGTNLNDVCDSASNATVDGAFANAYSSLQAYLNSTGGGSCSPTGASCTLNSDCCSNSCKGRSGNKTCK
ncbi:MAG: trypsin-like peptidase domain-containing protein [Thermoanaerobaculia bacterium]